MADGAHGDLNIRDQPSPERNFIRQRTLERVARSTNRRQRELDGRKRLQAEIDAIESPVRVMSPKQLAKLRQEVARKIGARRERLGAL